MVSAQYVIIGAGFAGAATAYHLTRRGVRDIVILEQEGMAGIHSSGRNASMVRQVVPEPAIMQLAKEGAEFLRNVPPDWPVAVSFERNGSLLLGSGEGWEKLCRDAEMGREGGIEAEVWSPAKARERVSILKNATFDGAIWCPTDGVVDVHALLSGYLRMAGSLGAQVHYGSLVRGFEVKGNRIAGVVTEKGFLEAGTVINAAGPWGRAIGALAGAVDVPLRPCRRHLFFTAPLPWVDRKWPFVWHTSHDMYFRPEAGGLLLCPCDQDEMPPGIPPTDVAVLELLADKIRHFFPEFGDVAIKSSLAGLRTLVPDGRFVIGWDPNVKGFFWVAGLGGHGVTTSSPVGALAASLILGERSGAGEFSPARFVV